MDKGNGSPNQRRRSEDDSAEVLGDSAVKSGIRAINKNVGQLENKLDGHIGETNRRFDAVDTRLDEMDKKLDTLLERLPDANGT